MEQQPVTGTGVVIARFQTYRLHDGHLHLLAWANERHAQLCVILGSKIGIHTKNNPLSFQVRKEMVLESFPNAIVLEVIDCPSDDVWSRRIDKAIRTAAGDEAVIYGSRDSFIPHYGGTYPVEIVPQIDSPSGTDLREECARNTLCSAEFRKGIIYAATERLATSYASIDCAVWKKNGDDIRVLLGYKEGDGGRYRFIGGFAEKTDPSYEAAARRELGEEAGAIETLDPEYLMSCPVADDRYEGSNDTIFTVLYAMEYVSGEATAGDDIEGIAWISLDRLADVIIPSHEPFIERLISFLHTKNDKQ
jgi:bifunctional NMN adenylyltransferase/nudix hydrolase